MFGIGIVELIVFSLLVGPTLYLTRRALRFDSTLHACICAGTLFSAIVVRAAPTLPVPPEAVIAVVPFLEGEEMSQSHVVIDLAPDGQRPFPLLLDTGASTSIITPRLARSLGVSVRRIKSTPYRKATRLGRDLQFWVDTRASDTASSTGWEVGVLGADFLDDYLIEIDYPARKVRFIDPDRYDLPERVTAPDECVLPFTLSGTRILIEFELEGRPVRAMLDTGASGTGLLSGKVVREVGVDVEALPEGMEIMTTRGVLSTRVLETRRFAFCGFAFERIGFLVSPRGWFNIAGPTDSALGHDILSQFTIRIDYERRRLWLKRSPSFASRYGGMSWAQARSEIFALPLSDAERQALRLEAEHRDAEQTERWKERQASRLFVEELGGWGVIEGHRRRRGPKPGEVWVSYDEMMRIRREQDANSGGQP